MRNSSRSVTFQLPFVLPELDSVQGAGTYIVDTEAEAVVGSSPAVFKPMRTVLRLVNGGTTRLVVVDPENLERALRHDNANAGMLRFARASNPDASDAAFGDDPADQDLPDDDPTRDLIAKR